MSSDPSPGGSALVFGEFVLDVANARLSRAGQVLALTPKPFALLTELARRPGELVSKDHLLDTVWRRRFVSDSAVKSVLSELRAALGDDARAPRWIETVQARGYRFVGAVQPAVPPAPALPLLEVGNLPLLPTPLLGRDDELQRLDASATEARLALLTLTGPAGVGKSLLALALAMRWRARWADGAWRVDLGVLSPGCDAATLRASLAHALRLSDAASRDDESLARSLLGLQLLLLLDNAEHVLEPLSPVLSHLLARLPGLQLLVTSREPLHLPMEQLHRVSPLSVPAPQDDNDPARCAATGAGQLFLARVAARQSGFALTADDSPALALLCRALDGLPLALELAAARVPTLGLRGLCAQLAPAELAPGFDSAPARLRLLGPSGPASRRREVRYQTLREALDWSHALLTPLQQRVLRRLAVFQGPFDLQSATRVAADAEVDDWGLVDTLEALVDRSLLVASADEPRRFHLLHSVRAHVAQRLVDAGEGPLAQARHFAAVLAYWRVADARALGDPALQWVHRHDHAIADLRAALAWGCDAVCASPPGVSRQDLLALAGASGLLWHRGGHAREGVHWCERVLALCSGASPQDRAGVDLALAHLGGIAMVLPAPQGLAAARRAVQALAGQADAVRENYALYLQHTLMCRAEPDVDRSACLQRLRVLVQPGWGELLRRFERSAAAYEARLQGRVDVYRDFNRAELARCRALGATWEAWSAGVGVMLAEHDNGRLAQAVAVGREVLGEIRAAGRLRQNANRLAMWLMMLAESGDTVEARAVLHEAVPILHGAGRGGMALLSAAWLAAHQGQALLAVQALARFDAPGGTGAEFGPGTFIRRSVGLLWARLRAEAGDAGAAEARASAEDLSDAEVLRQVLAGADACRDSDRC